MLCILTNYAFRDNCSGTVNYSMRPQTGTAVMVAPYLNNGMVQQFDCTASDGRFIRWYINGTIYLNTFSGSITVVVASINGSYSSYVTIPPMLYPLNVKCGDISGTYFSYNVTIVWILGDITILNIYVIIHLRFTCRPALLQLFS